MRRMDGWHDLETRMSRALEVVQCYDTRGPSITACLPRPTPRPTMAGLIYVAIQPKGEFHAQSPEVCFLCRHTVHIVRLYGALWGSLWRGTRTYQQRAFTLALGWQRRAVTRRPSHRLHRDHARSTRPPLRPTLDHGCPRAEIGPRRRRKRFRRRSAVVAGRQMVCVSGQPG